MSTTKPMRRRHMRRLVDVKEANLKLARLVWSETCRKARSRARAADPIRRVWQRIVAGSRSPDPTKRVSAWLGWLDYGQFAEDVGKPTAPQQRLCRIFADLPWRPGNTVWRSYATRGIAGNVEMECKAAGVGWWLRDRMLGNPVPEIPASTMEDLGGFRQKARDHGVKPGTARVRKSRGWTDEEALGFIPHGLTDEQAIDYLAGD